MASRGAPSAKAVPHDIDADQDGGDPVDDARLSQDLDSPSSAPAELRRLHNPRRRPSHERDDASLASTVDEDDDDEDGDRPGSSTSRAPYKPKRVSTFSKAYTPAEETAVLRKLDRRLVLFLALLYLLSFLDRSNIGNARIAGLEASLALSAGQFDWLLTAFYLTYIGFEWMILLYKLLPPHAYIACCVMGWGVVASLQALTTSFGQLLLLRGCLGITEAAFGPGVPFYMTFFYRRRELAYRVGLQISAAPLATSFASSLAWLIVWLNQKLGEPVESWRMLFLVEGFPSVLVGVLAWWWIPDGPGSARWLTPRERRVAVLRMKDEADRASSTSQATTSTTSSSSSLRGLSRWRRLAFEIRTTLRDPKCYLHALMFFSVNVSFASLPVFLPTVINAMSFSPLASQALAAPPYLFAFAFVLLTGHYSDRIADSRGVFLCATATLSAASYALIALVGLLSAHGVLAPQGAASIVLRYAAVYPAAMGLFASVTLIIAWTLNNQASSTGKGVAMTLLNVLGQCGPLVGVRLFPSDAAPFFVGGMAVSALFMGGVAVLAVGLREYLRRCNERVLYGGGGRGTAGDGDEGKVEEVELQERLMGARGDGTRDAADDDAAVVRPVRETFKFML